jgi:pilus assembly protein Flp/PilA
MKQAIVKFLREENGTEMVEWGLIAGLMIVVGAGLFAAIGGNLSTIFTALGAVTDQAATDAAGAGSGSGS